MRHRFQVFAGPLRATLKAARKQGVKESDLLDKIELSARALEGPAASVSLEKWTLLRENACQFTGDPLFHLVAAREISHGTFGLVQHLAQSRSFLGEVLEDLVAYGSYLSGYTRFDLEETGTTFRLSKSINVPLDLAGEDHALFAFASLVANTQLIATRRWRPVALRFVKKSDANSARTAAFFGTRVEFGAERDEVILDKATFSLPLLHGDGELAAVIKHHLEVQKIAVLSESAIAESVKARLIAALKGSHSPDLPKIEVIADELGMSSRTLQRLLAEGETTFTRLIDDARRDLAKIYVTELRLSSAEIAEKLKFYETSSFIRAFKRWYQLPPSKLRSSAARR